MTKAMGPPPPRNSMDSLPKTFDETSASSSPPTNISTPSEPETMPDLGSNGSVSNPTEKDISPVETSNTIENKNVVEDGGDERIKEQQLSVFDTEVPKAPVETSDSTGSKIVEDDGAERTKKQRSVSNPAVPYSIPSWSGPPCHPYFIEILKDGAVIDQCNINDKGAYMFGRVDLCDFVLEHPTISRFHAVIQFNSNGNAYLYDVGSTHGTSINKKQVKTRVYVDLHVGDVIRFGQSSRLYIFQGPADLMPPEADLKSLRSAKTHLEMQDMEASLRRAKINAALSEGVSWGMQEDAVEETEEDVEEITWQTYKGQLTEKQEKTREKVLKRLEKIAHMKKEIDAIRAKDIPQGGLTQGQQTQIARNEQRISQILEELENLEETLNESIQESIGARTGRTLYGRKKGDAEDGEEDYQSDDDEFYDRTKKPLKRKTGESQSVETADSLLDKQETIVKEMEDIKKLITEEEDKKQVNEIPDAGDALDAYMSAISTDLVTNKKDKLQKDLASLQTELDRVLYLLKIADPSGEAAKRRASSKDRPKGNVTTISASAFKQPQSRKPEQQLNGPHKPAVTLKPLSEKISNLDVNKPESIQKSEKVDEKPAVYVKEKPQWLGAVDGIEKDDGGGLKIMSDAQEEDDQFVDYKDRKNILEKAVVVDAQTNDGSEIENAAPGLIIRKRKPTDEKPEINNEAIDSEQSKNDAEMQAEDAVALLLKHSRGYSALNEEDLRHDTEDVPQGGQNSRRKQKKPKKMLGPERPMFLKPQSDNDDTWVPPEGQSGDGRTSLNDRYGY